MIQAIPKKQPASEEKIIKAIQQVLEKAYEHPIKSINIDMLIEYGSARVYTSIQEGSSIDQPLFSR